MVLQVSIFFFSLTKSLDLVWIMSFPIGSSLKVLISKYNWSCLEKERLIKCSTPQVSNFTKLHKGKYNIWTDSFILSSLSDQTVNSHVRTDIPSVLLHFIPLDFLINYSVVNTSFNTPIPILDGYHADWLMLTSSLCPGVMSSCYDYRNLLSLSQWLLDLSRPTSLGA